MAEENIRRIMTNLGGWKKKNPTLNQGRPAG